MGSDVIFLPEQRFFLTELSIWSALKLSLGMELIYFHFHVLSLDDMLIDTPDSDSHATLWVPPIRSSSSIVIGTLSGARAHT